MEGTHRLSTTRTRLLALVGVLALTFWACAPDAGEAPADDAPADTEAPATTAAPDEPSDGAAEPSGDPIRIGGSLALTGFLAPTAAIHQAVGELFVERLNEQGGLLGRPVEWVLLDDESVPDRAAALYERLITEEEVDLIVGPYGTGTITAAMAVAERFGYVIPHHTASLTYAYTYDCHFSSWSTGLHPNITNPNLLYDALESTGTPPETIGFVINEFPGTNFIAYGEPGTDEGGAVSIAQDRGWEVVLEVSFPTVLDDWGPLAAQVRDADPDFLYLAGLGVDAPNLISAMETIDHQVPGMFVQWPAPGPLLAVGEPAEGVMSVTIWEQHEPFTDDPEAAEVAEAINQALADAGIPYTAVETQASASWTAWEYLQQGVEGAGTLDNQAVCDWLIENGADTLYQGHVEFFPDQQNYFEDLSKIKQIQDGDFWVVWPEEYAAPGRQVDYSPER